MLLLGKSTISMGHGFHSYVQLPEGTFHQPVAGVLMFHPIAIIARTGPEQYD